MPEFVYLLHFDRPYWHARHYLGWSPCLRARLESHAAGSGAKLLRAVVKAGIGWTLAAVWPGTRTLERRLKRWHGAPAFCPMCREAQAMKEGDERPPIIPRWAPPPVTPADALRCPVPITDAGVEMFVLSDEMVGVWTHYADGRTRPCGKTPCDDGTVRDCWLEDCRLGRTAGRWQGWLAVSPVGSGQQRLVCVTPAAVACVPTLATCRRLRGMRLRLWRTHPGRGAKMQARLWTLDEHQTIRIPAAFDVRKVLCRMWEAPDRPAPPDPRPSDLADGLENIPL